MNTIRPTTTLRQTWARLRKSTGNHAPALRRAMQALAASALTQGLALACLLPIFIALLDHRDASQALQWLLVMLAMMGATTTLRWYGQGFDYEGRMSAATHAVRQRLGEQLRRMPLEQLQDRRAGELNALLLGSVDENLHYVLTIANLLLQAVLTPVVAAAAILWVDWRVGLLLLLVFPVIVPLYRWRRPAFGRGLRILAAVQARCAADILEYVQGLAVLRAARCTGDRARTLQASLQQLEQVQTIGQQKGARPNLIIASVVELGLLSVAALCAWWVADGSLSPAVLAAVLVMLARFSEPLSGFISFTAVLEVIEAALERIDTLMAVKPLPLKLPTQTPRAFDITFDNVDFAYAGSETPSLNAFNAEIPERRMVALVGPSGSGKTTVTRLLMRHADVQAGAVRIGGVDIRCIPPEQLNSLISVVFQDVYLFDDTVLANVRMARPEASDADVIAAARDAHCLAFIERLPQGWNTRLGEAGARLSGGERQRLSIARALLKQSPIVILDEPTAALDSSSEIAVQQAIESLVKERTVIVIAHRLSTITGADQILVMEHGRLVAAGDHPELLEQCARYKAMWAGAYQLSKGSSAQSTPLLTLGAD